MQLEARVFVQPGLHLGRLVSGVVVEHQMHVTTRGHGFVDLPQKLPDPLTEVIQAAARELLRTAVQAEVSGFMTAHAHLLDEEGRQRLVRHGFLPEREVMTGIGTVPVQETAASLQS